MDFTQLFQFATLWNMVSYIVPFIVALTIIVFVHEYGHFIVGRWCGVKIEVFSVGFGRELFGFNDRHGTRWKFCLWPLGGYVRFQGDANAASMPDTTTPQAVTSLHAKPVWQRAAIVFAGPFANFLLTIVIFAGSFALIGLPYAEPTVSEVVAGSAAEKAGLIKGDRIYSVDGAITRSFASVQEAVWLRAGEELDVTIERNGAMLPLKLTPQVREEPDGFGGIRRVGQLGVKHFPAADEPKYQRFAPHEALAKGVERTWYIIATTGKFIGKLVSGQQSVKQVGGAISIGKGAADAASDGPWSFIFFIGLLSVSVGLINLFPVPMLDGGHLVYYAIEAVRGKPLGPQAQEWGFRLGFSLVVMLMVLGLFNDAGRIVNHGFGT